jgi:transcription elongation factor/antiterminator RfaH
MQNWYALYTRPRHEKKVTEMLLSKGVEVYLPLLNTRRKLKDRIRMVELPLFPSYVFCKFEYKERFSILETQGIIKIVNFHGVPSVVPDWQIESLKKVLENPESLQMESYFRQGDLVEVKEGPFKGLRGTVKKIKGESRLAITIEGIMQSISVEIDPDSVETVKTPMPAYE